MSDAAKALRDLAQSLRSVNVERTVGPVLSRAGAQMRDRAREQAPAGPHLPAYQRQIQFKRTGLSVDVYARSEGQGNLGAVLEFGQGPNAPHPHILPQLEPESEVAARYIADALTRDIT